MSSNYSEFLPYIDVPDGLARMQNNKKLYARLLKSYLLTTSYESMAQPLQENQTAAARETIHSFKGVSANLSLTKNFTLSAALEAIVKENGNYATALAELKASIETTKELVNKLIPLLETL